MIILGYTKTYEQGRQLAISKGHPFAYVVQDREYNRYRGCRFCVMI